LPTSSYLGYRAPEIILTAPHLQKSLSEDDWKAADVWSCGCIFAQLLFKYA
jgi:serine/threonine protein kinase